VLNVLDAALWLVLVGAYLAQGPRIVPADLRDLCCRRFALVILALLLRAPIRQRGTSCRFPAAAHGARSKRET
jgi:hypothetical protein